MNVFIDTNILLDALAASEPFYTGFRNVSCATDRRPGVNTRD